MPPRTLPASWFQSKPLYELERRAIFLKSWHLLGPITRFVKRQEKVFYEIAQVTIYVINTAAADDETHANAGIEVHQADQGDGRAVRSHLTPSGLLFATLSADAGPFDAFFPGLEALTNTVDFTRLRYRRSLSYEGNFNWKTMMDGYQECLHCQYTHPSFSKLYPPTTYSVSNHTNFSQHLADPSKRDDGLFLYFFPVCTLNVYGGGMSSFRTCPSPAPGVSRMEFDYYFEGSDLAFENYFAFLRQVAVEDFELCEGAQRNLERGVYGEGVLNPVQENGVAYYQQQVRKLVLAEYELQKQQQETEQAREIEAENNGIGQSATGSAVGVGA